MYSSVLWATDGSPEADGALREAVELLEPGGLLVALHSDQRFSGGRIGGEHVAVDESERQEHIEEQVAELRRSGVSVKHVVRTSHHDPAHDIPTIADELDVDAIVCGTSARHGLNALLNGSVAARVLRHATVPVIVVPARAGVCNPETAAV